MNKELDEKLNFGVVSELLKGPEWKSVEEIVKFTFRALNELIISHSLAIKDLERGLSSKISKADFFSEISKKVDNSLFLDQLNDCRQEFRSLVNEVDSKLYEKASFDDLQIIAQEKIGKEQVDYLISTERQENIEKISEVSGRIEGFEPFLNQVNSGVVALKTQIKECAGIFEVEELGHRLKKLENSAEEGLERVFRGLEGKVEERFLRSQEIVKKVQDDLKRVENCVESVGRGLEDVAKGKASNTELFKFVEMTSARLDTVHQTSSKSNLSLENLESRLSGIEKSLFHQFSEYQKIQEFIRKSNEKLTQSLENLQKSQDLQTSSLTSIHSDLLLQLESKANIDSLNQKADFSIISSELSKKLDESFFFLRFQDLSQKLSSITENFSLTFNNLNERLSEKAGIKEICNLIDKKAGIHEINLALVQIHEEIDLKQLQFEKYKEKNDDFLNSWCMDHVIGRWRGSNGSSQRGGVLWDLQVLGNENFVWESGSTCVLSVKGGLFEVTLAVFSMKRPNVQVLVNGEVVLSAVQSQFNVTGNTGKLKNVKISGVSAKEILNLPHRARVSVVVTADDAECFLDLRKMS